MPLLPSDALDNNSISVPLGRGTLVGDVILGARELINDLPQVLPPPGNELQVVQGSPSIPVTLPAGSYYVVLTYRSGSVATPWGETTPSTEYGPIVVDATHSLQITGNIPAGVGSVAAYFGTAAGGENNFTVLTETAFDIVSTGSIGTPPIRNCAYLPDTSGRSISAAALYRWLNEGMDQASTICHGLPDFGAVATEHGQPIYPVNGRWTKLANAWYDGYPLFLGRQIDVFRRNTTPGTVGTMVLYQKSNRFVVEVWPQPSRTSGRARTTAAIGRHNREIPVELEGGPQRWVVGFGLCSLGDPEDPNYEIIEFARNNTFELTGVTRGMQGTRPFPWPEDTPVRELNLMWGGQRVPTGYRLGDSTTTFHLPEGWADCIISYITARFAKANQQIQEATALEKSFAARCQLLVSRRTTVGPRQISAFGGRGTEVGPFLGGPFGGVIVP